MKKAESHFIKLSTLLLTAAVMTVGVLRSFSSTPAFILTPQGKGGEVVAKPTPTPKKATPAEDFVDLDKEFQQ